MTKYDSKNLRTTIYMHNDLGKVFSNYCEENNLRESKVIKFLVVQLLEEKGLMTDDLRQRI